MKRGNAVIIAIFVFSTLIILNNVEISKGLEPPALTDIALSGGKKTLAVGETWDIGFGRLTLTAQAIDARTSPRQVWLILNRGDSKWDDAVLNERTNYTYIDNNYEGYANVLLFRIYVDSIFSGATTDMVQLKYLAISPLVLSCTEDWSCINWRECLNNIKTRTCTDYNRCGTNNDKPETSQACVSAAVCTENWNCGAWSACVGGIQVRNCVDNNVCGTNNNMPEVSQSCQQTCTENWQCLNWNDCINNQKNRTCIDLNLCGTTANRPVITMGCVSNQTNLVDDAVFIKNTKVEVVEDKGIITSNDNSVSTNLDLDVQSGKVYVNTSIGKREIQVLPEEAIAKFGNMGNIAGIEIINEQGEAVYLIKGKIKARVLAVFPVNAEVQMKVSAETGKIISIKKPWWAFLASGV